MRHLVTLGLGAVVAAATITGCGQSQSVSAIKSGSSNDSDIFSNRPIAPRPQVLTVHLSSPALLTVSRKTANGWVIPPAAKQRILAEQEAFISRVKGIKADIQVLYTYRLVINAVALVASSDLKEQIEGLTGVTSVQISGTFGRPMEVSQAPGGSLPSPTSVDFIGATEAQKNGIDGTGVRVGIIDTGIDYTHAMLGGHGDPAEYAAIKPDQPTPLFPNSKVIGGTDLVGTNYDAASELPINYIPKPDGNPLDEAGHGSHVAGTVAGIGDGVNTYTGVAPKAKLYAIKVFGKEGSTSDAVVIAGLEYAADPTGQMNPNNQLDVVNLSLGGDYGSPHILYAEAVRNLSNAGTAVIAAAGNSGPKDNIVGAPGTSTEALSVAASVDGAPVNWRFSASQITINGQSQLVKAVEGNISKPVAQADGVQGKLVFIGIGDQPVAEPLKSQVSGNVALMIRGGGIPFANKIKVAADAGAIGVVVINNQDGEPIAMGGDGSFNIPAIMITLDLGKSIAQALDAKQEVSIVFKTSQVVEQPQLIDTITSFSSKGPRSEDDLIKPEIAAPGAAVLSAAMGKGHQGVRFDGTSMATPHMTGVIALMRQAHPELSVAELKALVMNTAKVISDQSKNVYPISMQGAGRVQVLNALAAKSIATPSISLGLIQSSQPKTISKAVKVTNLSDQPQTYQISYEGSTYMKVQGPTSIEVPADSSREFSVKFTIAGLNPKALAEEVDGRVYLKSGSDTLEIPALAMRTEVSSIRIVDSNVGEKSTVVNLENDGLTGGEAIAFNLLGQGKRKHSTGPTNNWMSKSCNLKSAGYRFVQIPTQDGTMATRLQFAFELFDPLTTWNYCELNVQFDLDGDGQADYELAGVSAATVGDDSGGFASVLMNATKMRDIRSTYEKKIRQGLPVANPDYGPAMITAEPMISYENSTIGVIQVDVTKLGVAQGKTVGIKVAVTNDDSDNALEPDDYLTQNYQTLSIDPAAQAYTDLPFVLALDTKAKQTMNLTRGAGQEALVIYLPENVSGDTSRIIK